jgi:hypothetical protein
VERSDTHRVTGLDTCGKAMGFASAQPILRARWRACEMRYLHQDVDEICKYILANGLNVYGCGNDGTSLPTVASTGSIAEMLKVSASLWGLQLNYYVRVAKSPAKNITLSEAVEEVEQESNLTDFLIIAYQDGGLVSVSGVQLPFQNMKHSAQWWKPWAPRA